VKTEELIEAALQSAKDRGIKIVRGPVFDWRDSNDPFREGALPSACNAVGAVLLHFGKQDMARNGFQKGWLEELCSAMGATWPWLWRFNHGWDRGNCLSVTFTEKGKEKTAFDDTSADANRMALKWT
jgi:hypothetical protein